MLREECVRTCRRMYDRGLIAAADGNLSVRLGNQHLLVTPGGVHKGFLEPSELIRTDLDGRPGRGERGRPTSELALHTAVYRDRPDVGAVIHAHPPIAVACSVAGVDFDEVLVPEVVFGLGRIATVPYTTPTTDDVPAAAVPYLREHDGLILARHGSLTVGPDLMTAFVRLETIEQTARITWLARTLGSVRPLPADEVTRLQHLAGRLPANGADIEEVVLQAARAVLKRLAGGGSP